MSKPLKIKTQPTMSTIRINAQGGTMTLEGHAIATNDDKTDIISHLTSNDDNGVEFQALCDASTAFTDETVESFFLACEAWLEGYRKARR